MDRLVLPDTVGIPSVEEIVNRIEPALDPDDRMVVCKAYDLARQAHEGQLRKSGEPYFVHCARVGWLLAGLVNDPATIAAGLLHDTIEDCELTREQLAQQFPAPIAELVDGVTKISKISFTTDQEHQVENLRKMILAMARDVRVVLIKLCDRLHNMQTLDYLQPVRQRAIAQTTMDIYAPLANRLGMTRIRSHLEDLSMKYLFPTAYRDLNKKMAVRQLSDQRIVDATREIMNELLKKNDIPATIQGRTKHLYSTHMKMRRQGLRFDEVHDILAIRIITESINECYEILGMVHSLWKPIPGKFKDYIATPKENGYRSIHTSVVGLEGEVTEIQIRTQEMHQIAEEGIAAHWRYKEDGVTPNPTWGSEEKRLAWLRQLVDWLQEVRDPSEFMSELKRDVFEVSVFCYTPAGDILEMPRGATALDLAYRIHTHLGNQCAGAKINNRMVSIRTPVQMGDIVEILTSKGAHPTPDWIQIAKTGRARNKIRHYLKTSQRDVFIEQAHRSLIEAIRSRFGSGVDETRVIKILEPSFGHFSVASFEDLLLELGCGTIRQASVIGRLDHVLRPPHPAYREPRATRRKRKHTDVVLVEGMAGTITRMARCCSPLPGDDIVGFITQGRGISIHRADCGSMASIRQRTENFEGRSVHVEWGDASQTLKKAAIRLVCNDRKGLLSDITTAVTQLNVSIVGAHTTSQLRDNRAIMKIVVLIEDSDQLNQLLNRLTTIHGVLSLSRVVHKK